MKHSAAFCFGGNGNIVDLCRRNGERVRQFHHGGLVYLLRSFGLQRSENSDNKLNIVFLFIFSLVIGTDNDIEGKHR